MTHTSTPPTPRHGGFPGPLVLPLSSESLVEALKYFRTLVQKDQLIDLYRAAGVVIDAAHLTGDPDEDKERVRQVAADWFRGFQKGHAKTLHAKLVVFKERRAALVGYEPWLLLGRPEAGDAYRFLAEGLYFLGQFAFAIDSRSEFRDESPQIESYVHACAALLARLCRCDCWTAYVWRGEEILPTLVDVADLWYPEAAVGLAHVLTTSGHERGESSGCIEVLTTQSAAHVGFQCRECIERCWVVRLSLGVDTAVVYLNWRRKGETGPTKRHTIDRVGHRVSPRVAALTKAILLEMGEWPGGHSLTSEDQISPRSFDAMVRQMAGWLAERCRGATAAISPSQFQSVTARELQQAVFVSLQGWLSGRPPRDANPTSYLASGFAPELKRIIRQHILSDTQEQNGIDIEVLPVDGKYLQLPAVPLFDWNGRPVSHEGRVSIEPGSRGLTEPSSSIAAQSVAWATSILLKRLPSMDQRWTPHEHSLVRRVLSRKPWADARSELAVPIFSGTDPIAAVSVEIARPDALSHVHLRWLEATSLFVGALFEVIRSADGGSELSLLHETFIGRQPPDDEEALWSAFTKWAQQTARADLIHVVTRGDGSGMLDRFAAIASARYVTGVVEELAERRSWAHTLRLLRSDHEPLRNAGIRELIRSERAGITRELLAGSMREYEWKPGDEAPRRKWLARPLHGGVVGLAISSNARVTPYAAVWLGWCDRSAASRGAELERIRRVASVFAALHLLYRVEEFGGVTK